MATSNEVVKKSMGQITWNYMDTNIEHENFMETFKTKLLPLCSRPSWRDKEPFKIKVFSDGLTNKLIGICPEGVPIDEMILMRFNGLNTDTIINREREVASMVLLEREASLSVPVYCQFSNGLCYGFANGRVMAVQEMSNFTISEAVIRSLARLHRVKVDEKVFGSTPKLDDFLVEWIERIPTVYDSEEKNIKFNDIYGGSSEVLKREVAIVRKELSKFKSPLVVCHNDLLSGNLIYEERNNTVHMIDFEYCGLNPRAFDIGDHFCEFSGIELDDIDYRRYPSEEYQKKWIHRYLQEVAYLNGESQDIDQSTVHELYREANKYALAAHLAWSIWALIQAASSNIDFDYMKYSGIRFGEYLRRKNEFLSL